MKLSFSIENCQSTRRSAANCIISQQSLIFWFLFFVIIQDYIQALSVLARGSIKEKLRWLFSFYDISDDGKLTKQV